MHRAAHVGWALLFIGTALAPLAAASTVTQTWTQTSQTDFLQGSGDVDLYAQPGSLVVGASMTTDLSRYTTDQGGNIWSQQSAPYVTSGQGSLYGGRDTCCGWPSRFVDIISTPVPGKTQVTAYVLPGGYYAQYSCGDGYSRLYLRFTDSRGNVADNFMVGVQASSWSGYYQQLGGYSSYTNINGWSWFRFDFTVPSWMDGPSLRAALYQDSYSGQYCGWGTPRTYMYNYVAFGMASQATFTSNVHNAVSLAQWGTISYDGVVPSGTTLKVQTRTSGNGADFSEWATALSGEPVPSPAGQFIQYRAILTTSSAGSARLDSVSITYSFTVDTTPPVTRAKLSGQQGCANWYVSTPTVTLEAQDDLSGVQSTFWSLDGGFFVLYGTPFPVEDGVHTLEFYSVDNAGNVEAVKSISFKADTVAPGTSQVLNGSTYGSYVTPATRFALTASDATSGVKATSVDAGSGLQAYADAFAFGGPDGARTIGFQSEDKACNVERLQRSSFFVDGTAPDVSITHPTAGSFSVLGTDSGSVPMYADVVAAADSLGIHGSDVDSLVAIVHAGAVEECGPALADKCAALALLGLAPQLGGSIVVGAVDVDASAADPLVNGGASGLARVAFFLDGQLQSVQSSAPFSWHWDATNVAAGQHDITVLAQDRLGNAATARTSVSVVPAGPGGVLDTGSFALRQVGAPQFAQDLYSFVRAKVEGVHAPACVPAGVPGVPCEPVPTPDQVTRQVTQAVSDAQAQVEQLVAQLPTPVVPDPGSLIPSGLPGVPEVPGVPPLPDVGGLPDPGSLIPSGLPGVPQPPSGLPPLPQVCLGDTCVPPN